MWFINMNKSIVKMLILWVDDFQNEIDGYNLYLFKINFYKLIKFKLKLNLFEDMLEEILSRSKEIFI